MQNSEKVQSKINPGGELKAYKPIISQNESLSILFKPEIASELSEGGLEDVKDSLRLEVTFIPTHGNKIVRKTANGKSIKPQASGNRLFFGLTKEDISDIIKTSEKKEGILEFRVLEEITVDGASTERYLEVVDESRMVENPETQPGLSYVKDAAKSLQEMAEKDITDVNVLKPVFNKGPLPGLFKSIENGTNKISFENYNRYIEKIFCLGPEKEKGFKKLNKMRFLPFNDTDSYRVLKVASEAFLMLYAGVCCNLNEIGSEEELIQHLADLDIRFATTDSDNLVDLWNEYLVKEGDVLMLPYLYLIRQKFGDVGITSTWIDDLIEQHLCNCSEEEKKLGEKCFGVVRQRLQCPLFIELMWSYWQEEGMLVQCMNAITRRFQNMRSSEKNDPLAEMEISHLRPLNNIMWGYIQDEQHRLSIIRRAYEYDHHYGITLEGKAVPTLNSADSRTRFMEAFHGLLHITAKYYTETANKLVEPDAYPLLNALREVHFVIAEGMHNQYGDLPCTARLEMLMQQWILARPEFREFLPGRAAIPFTEPWMDRVSSMNKLQNWSDISPMQFDYLAKYGEQLLLSIRFGDWSSQYRTRNEATLWANYFRNQIQGYIHSYKTVTGVDLTTTLVGNKIDSRPPSYHLAQRLKSRQNGKIPTPSQNGIPIKKEAVKKEWY